MKTNQKGSVAIIAVIVILVLAIGGYFLNKTGMFQGVFNKSNSRISSDILECALPENPDPNNSYDCLERLNQAADKGERPKPGDIELDWPDTVEGVNSKLQILKEDYPSEYTKIKSGEMDMRHAIIFITRTFAAKRCMDKSENDFQVISCVNSYTGGPGLSLYNRITTQE